MNLIKFFSASLMFPLFISCYNGDKTLIPKEEFTPNEVEEGYNLKVEPKVDILFLIDDSGSMGAFQDEVASNISLFTAAMGKNKFLDYQIGVTTTDDANNGKLKGTPSYVTKTTVDGLVQLENTIRRLGTSGSATEKFFDPAYSATDVLVLNPKNPGFMRSDAFFVLIIVSDSYDQSIDKSAFKVYNSLVNGKAYDKDKALAYAVLAYPEFFEDGCSREETEPENLFNFISLFTNAYNTKIGGGINFIPRDKTIPKNFLKLTNVFSLCDPDFGQKLANIGDDIRLRVSQKIPLPVRPIDGTIKLKYGTQVIDKKWWKYDFGTNSIILDPEVELDENQVDPQLFVSMDEADPLNTIGKPAKPR